MGGSRSSGGRGKSKAQLSSVLINKKSKVGRINKIKREGGEWVNEGMRSEKMKTIYVYWRIYELEYNWNV